MKWGVVRPKIDGVPTGRRRALSWCVAAVAVSLLPAGCGDGDATGPAEAGGFFSEAITFEELESRVATAEAEDRPSRVEVELRPGNEVAREVELEAPEEVFDDEEIEGRAVAVTGVDLCPGGSVTLAVGAFQVEVAFDAGTELEAEGSGSDELSCPEFVSRIQEELAAGRRPRVEAERPARVPAQDPDDAAFLAAELEIEDEDDDEDEIEVNIDSRHLQEDAGTGERFIVVLGLPIRVGPATEIEAKRAAEVEFEGIVECASIDLAADSFALSDGTTVRIVEETGVEVELDGEERPGTLGDVDAACTADPGILVEAEGEGVPESTEPPVIVASEVEFEVEDD